MAFLNNNDEAFFYTEYEPLISQISGNSVDIKDC